MTHQELARTDQVDATLEMLASKSVKFNKPVGRVRHNRLSIRYQSYPTGRSWPDGYTNEPALAAYRMGRFKEIIAGTPFEDLQEVPQDNGNTRWTALSHIDGQRHLFHIDNAEILGSVTHTEVKSDAEIERRARELNIDPHKTYITIDGKRYFLDMKIPMHFDSPTAGDTVIEFGVSIIGQTALAVAIASAIAKFGPSAFKDVLTHITTDIFKTLWAIAKGFTIPVFKFTQILIRSLVTDGVSLAIAFSRARAAAGAAWEGAFETISTTTLKYSLAGVILMVAVGLITHFVLHYSYQHVTVYNLTGNDIRLSFPYEDEGSPHGEQTNLLRGQFEDRDDDGNSNGSFYTATAFRYQSDSVFKGLGYTMRLDMIHPDHGNVMKSFSCLFDVPFTGKNSLHCINGTPVSGYENYYKDVSGEHKTKIFTSTDGKHEMIVTYDNLSGKHPAPGQEDEMYYYNSLVIVRDVPNSTLDVNELPPIVTKT